jgi:hypothetical protein
MTPRLNPVTDEVRYVVVIFARDSIRHITGQEEEAVSAQESRN